MSPATAFVLRCCGNLIGTVLLAAAIATPAASQEPDRLDDLLVDYPGSIIEQIEEDEERKDSLFQIPGVGRAMRSWYAFKASLEKRHGVQFGLSFTTLYQKASDTFAPKNGVKPRDDAAGFDLDFAGVWTFRGRDTDRPTTVGLNVLHRNDLGTKIPPLLLFGEAGSLYSTAAGYSEAAASVAQLWLQQKFGDRFGFRLGKRFPIVEHSFFPFQNFRRDFHDFNHVTNAAIPLPDYGLGGFVQFRPRPESYVRLGVHDANADVERAGFDTLFGDGELFTILEAGFDPGFTPRQPGQPPVGDIHVSFWHQDKRSKFDVVEGKGVAVAAMQKFGRVTPFLRYGYADGGARGPTPIKHMVNAGLVFDEIFGQSDDRIGIAFTWSDPADSALSNQNTIDAYYRVYVTPEIAISPTLQVVFDPVRNPGADVVFFSGFRTRLAF